jgi:hypothetical protein
MSEQASRSEREQKEIKLARYYADECNHGTSGHLSLNLIAKQATLIEELTELLRLLYVLQIQSPADFASPEMKTQLVELLKAIMGDSAFNAFDANIHAPDTAIGYLQNAVDNLTD